MKGGVSSVACSPIYRAKENESCEKRLYNERSEAVIREEVIREEVLREAVIRGEVIREAVIKEKR